MTAGSAMQQQRRRGSVSSAQTQNLLSLRGRTGKFVDPAIDQDSDSDDDSDQQSVNQMPAMDLDDYSSARSMMRNMHLGLDAAPPTLLTDPSAELSADSIDIVPASRNLSPTLSFNPMKRGESVPTSTASNVFQRVKITGQEYRTDDTCSACEKVLDSLRLRDKWRLTPQSADESTRVQSSLESLQIMEWERHTLPPRSQHQFEMKHGVVSVWLGQDRFEAMSVTEFYSDLKDMMRVVSSGPCKTLAYRRLQLLEARFNLHILLNEETEQLEAREVPHRDFYNIRKVDNHVHHSACMNQKHLLRFMKSKLKKEAGTVCRKENGRDLTLREVFSALNLKPYDLSIDTLDMHAHQDTFHRFDKFNLKYNPIGESSLREIFLKTDNVTGGRFLAEITREVFDDLEENKYQFAEYRLSIYGKSPDEWTKLSSWVCNHSLQSTNVVWLIQIPRIFQIYKSAGILNNFQELLDNVFKPLFEVTIDPACNPQLHVFLKHVVGFDSVDDESLREVRTHKKFPPPDKWDFRKNPPYSYYLYYMHANLVVLNKLRAARGMNTFSLRPHAGEAGDVEHLAVCYLLADSINHGIQLRKSPVLQYLYYLSQVGLSVSPLSNNLLFRAYDKNPAPVFFARGLNVTLSTDDPLMIHFTKQPLIEEYSIASQVWKLSSVDMSEMARNSVLQSGFDHRFKQQWIGENYRTPGKKGNCIEKTNVPNTRIIFRHELLNEEHKFVSGTLKSHSRVNSRRGTPSVTPGLSPSPERYNPVHCFAAGAGASGGVGKPPTHAPPANASNNASDTDVSNT